MKFGPDGCETVREVLDELETRHGFREFGLIDLVEFLLSKGIDVHVMYIDGEWLQVNESADVSNVTVGAVDV